MARGTVLSLAPLAIAVNLADAQARAFIDYASELTQSKPNATGKYDYRPRYIRRGAGMGRMQKVKKTSPNPFAILSGASNI